MHIQSQGPDGLFYGWDNSDDIPADHRQLTDAEIQERTKPEPMTRQQVEQLRLTAYADPVTGSDRFFAEAARLQAMGGSADEIEAAHAAGAARYAETQAAYPWP